MAEEERDGVRLTSLDQPLGDGLGVTKGDLVDHLDAFADRIVPLLAGRPLTIKRVRPGSAPFMQKNVSKGAPDWVRTVTVWSEAAHREVHQVLCEDRRTLLWLANQRAVEYHVPFLRVGGHEPTGLVLTHPEERHVVLDRPLVGQPQQGAPVVAEHLPDLAVRALRPHRRGAHPVGRPLGHVALHEGLLARAHPLHRQRAAGQQRDQPVGHGVDVVDEVALGDLQAVAQRLVEAGQPDAVPLLLGHQIS